MTTTTPHPTDTGAGPLTGAGIDAPATGAQLEHLARRIERLDRNLLLVLRIVSNMADKYPPLAAAVARAMKDTDR